MKKDIILAGVGGQGILSIATIIGYAVVQSDLNLKQAEVHGMSQRGGAVESHLRISNKEIHSDLVPHGRSDMIISLEPMESLRYFPYLKHNGWLITNITPFVNIPNYPEMEHLLKEIRGHKNSIAIDGDAIAKKIGSPRSTNMVILGAAAPFLEIPFEMLENSIRTVFCRKGEDIVKKNLDALSRGRDFAEKHIQK
ncbi:MAG: indolepyruvate oxidoreductase subunit beta [Candidatus Celaenobacter antarcticus]|nr:indolepyruvate oxidoreductase subunit beta [Candidatus Celaenobacter antarcticus]MDP8313794.1 indolepyruvate oxidoreductase subunit beta [Candidatus Celaenobacter antarcticus]